MTPPSALEEEESRSTGRVEAFSDGVFAIAITLLVLDLKIPTPAALGDAPLGPALVRQWPTFLA
ncbi:MAG TPA: TMEM175 family protein, partial [Thermoanaerobaculia bacterium]|nr:TMEM175 family protein [Thermoanaerobaculia bacterium]